MIKVSDKSLCCGCGACVQRCPKQCISMNEDDEGFLYPQVDETLCIDCGLCEKVCPVINQGDEKKPLATYAAKSSDDEIRLKSSSGGLFTLIAEQVLRQGGVVFGARFNKGWNVEHAYTETIDGLQAFRGSKYVQSKIGNSFLQARSFLNEGREVLFSGTQCQIAALKSFLQREYANLITIDVICHGVPSPAVWRNYLESVVKESERSEADGKNTVLPFSLNFMSEIADINFREKQYGGYGWKKYGFVVHAKSPSKGDQNSVLLSSTFGENIFMKCFLANLSLRPSCYSCPAKAGKSGSDITLADFWGIQNLHPEFDDDKGVNLVLVNSTKGDEVFHRLDVSPIEVTYDEAVQCNPSHYQSVAIPKYRKLFWKLFHSRGIMAAPKVFNKMKPSYFRRFIHLQKRIVSLIVKRS